MNNLPPCWPPQSTIGWRTERNRLLRNILIGAVFVFIAFWMLDTALGEVLWKVGDGSIVIDPAGRTEYNKLIKRYGANFVPPLRRDDGLKRNERWYGGFNPSTSYVIAPDYVVFLSLMKEWRFYRINEMPEIGSAKRR